MEAHTYMYYITCILHGDYQSGLFINRFGLIQQQSFLMMTSPNSNFLYKTFSPLQIGTGKSHTDTAAAFVAQVRSECPSRT